MEKSYKNGLILGKFMPFSKGHQYLIESALAKCDKLTVLVCTLTSEPISGELRYQWVKDTFPTVNVVHVTKNIPLRLNDLTPKFTYDGHDYCDEYFWSVWIDIIKDACQDIDVIFTSEQYGFELVQRFYLGTGFMINHELVDIARERFPISGSDIRKNPLVNWKYIPDNVKSYFVKKIAIVGPESVGKSTITKRLATTYHTSYVPEYGREFTNDKNMSLDTKEFTLDDISKIAAGHLFREEEALKNAGDCGLFFSDTETITTEIWSEIYFGKTPQWLRELNKVQPYKYDMYFLLTPEVPWVDDGTRYLSNQEERWSHYEKLRDALEKRNLPYAIVDGADYEERFKKIVYGINYFILTKNEH